ncbi:hypothetical protein GTA08_BOTSDO13792 [Neofusicoccum parvum]|uniref:Uncharacterized protein n=1 Tax=Neofusicoccum parvum TaxID=310453 RepID=A0ACB5RT39_9PEZI|nr:hypothetical protein GTA08_BOTSDO13792 [Neofusicoccum parvum]
MAEIHTRDLNPPYRKSVHPSKPNPPLQPAPPPNHTTRTLENNQTLLETDVPIPTRDGTILYADVYRPHPTPARTPTLIFFAPFGKHGAVPRSLFHNMGVDFTMLSAHTHWELPDPFLWCTAAWGYSFVLVDPRGTWWSGGSASHYLSAEEGRDGFDVVEWAAAQAWATGRVGWGAVSYYAMSAYHVAARRPPHLAAVMPWEGISDLYREVNAQGGVPNVAFQQFWMGLTGNGLGEAEDHAVMMLERPLFDELWASKVADWSRIEVPAFSVTGWASLGLHLRGTILAWKGFSSRNKYLLVHAGKEWREYYREESVLKQKAFWDRFLKDQPNEVDSWSPVTIDVRIGLDNSITRAETTFPPSKARLTAFQLGSDGKLNPPGVKAAEDPAFVSYTAHKNDSSVLFSHTFSERTEITGNSSAKLFVQALGYPDTDLYVALQKIDRNGEEVKFWHSTQKAEASASFGWLRVSHRELDEEKSVPGMPVHLHRRRQWLRPSDIEEVLVEIWPSSTIWEEGETIRLVVQGHPFTDADNMTQFKGTGHNFGEVRIWYGGEYDSHLLAPIIET